MSKKPVAKRESKKPAPKRRPAAKRRTLSERVRDLERRVEHLEAEAPRTPKAGEPGTMGALLKHAGTWVGDDLEELLELAYATRSKARF